MTIPFTSVSLGFNSQIEPWRSQLHADTPGTLALFGITPTAYKHFVEANEAADPKTTIRQVLATAEDMVATAVAIEKGFRDAGGEPPSQELKELIDKFLQMAATWMVAEVALGVTAPDQSKVDKPGELIRRLFLALYSSEFREHPNGDGFDQPAWDALLKAVNDGKTKFDELLPHCRILCGAVAQEFIDSLWPDVW